MARRRSITQLDDAGLIIKVVDGMEDQGYTPWHACLTDWCGYVDHVSASLVNQQLPALYHDQVNGAADPAVGFVLAGDVRFECAFTSDLGSIQLARGGCGGNSWGGNAWLPNQLAGFLEACTHDDHTDYNEVIFLKVSFRSQRSRGLHPRLAARR